MKPVRFSIFTSIERNAAISEVSEALSRSGGWIEDQTFFSNKAATIRFEMPICALEEFQRDILKRGLRTHVDDQLPANEEGDVKGTISLTFSHSEPDLKREVPPFG